MAWTQEKRAEWGRAQATPEHIAKMNEARERLKRERVEAIFHVRRLVNTGRGGEALTWVLSEAPTNRAVGEMLTTLNGRRALVIDHQLQRIPDSRKADWPLGEDVTDLGNGFWLCPPKTDSGERIVVLDDVMCGALDEWLAIRKQKGVDSPMLFVTGRGTPIDRRIEYFHWDQGAAANRHSERRGWRQAQAALREAHGGHALRQRRRAGESPARADGPQRRRDGQRVPARGHRGVAEGQRGRDRCAGAERLALII